MGLIDFDLSDIGETLVKAREAWTGKRVVDPKEMAEIEYKFEKLTHMANQGQIEVNKIEAAHKNIFVAGWRPFIGWTSGAGVAYAFVVKPFLDWVLKIFVAFSDKEFTPEQIAALQPVSLDTATLMSLITALLGMASLRTYEKYKDVARNK